MRTDTTLNTQMDSQLLLDSNESQSRGQNALQRRAQQLKRWHEQEMVSTSEGERVSKHPTRVQFSPTTLFLSSVAQNDVQECERLLRDKTNDCDVNATTGDGLTALHQMAIDDNQEMLVWLLKHGADVNCRDNEGWTPLHASASCGHLEIVKLLLESKECDVFAINCDGELARDVCEGEECVHVIEQRMRRELGLSVDDDSVDDMTTTSRELPEHVLKELRKKEMLLIENDFNSIEKNEKSIKQWIERTRDPQSRASVLHVCAAKGYNELLEKILSAIADKISFDSIVDCDGFTALHASAFWQQMSTFETLLRFGANFELKTRDSRVVSDLCHENPKIMELMSETKIKRDSEIATEPPTPTTTVTFSLTGSETQRRLNAKRQRESRRSTQGVAKEDIEMALKSNAINENIFSVSMPATPSTTPPPMPSSPPPITTATITLPLNEHKAIQIRESRETREANSNTIQPQQRRRQKRRSTGITTESDQSEENNAFVATSHDMTDDRDDCVVDSSSETILSATPSSTTTTPATSWTSSRSSSRTSSIGTNDDNDSHDGDVFEGKTSTVSSTTTTSDDLTKDYKKLYFELLKENEFLIKKLKDFENNRKEFQEFQREKRQLSRRISELEEELKIKEDLKQENNRLKDENSALIRVISKLSK